MVVRSEVLRNNPLGDPHEREVWVYTPPGYEPGRPLPALLALAGFTGHGPMLFNTDPLGASLGARLDRLIASGACPPCIVVAPDCFTRLGGNQYIDSTATGAYATHLVREVVPQVASAYAIGRWGVFGKSSGGYGAVVLAMLYPDVFQAFADHSGDANFELCYFPDALETLDQVRQAGGVRAWLDAYWASPQRRMPKQVKALNFLAMAAHYSPNPEAELGFDLPFDRTDGRFLPDVWARWQAWDPVRMVERHVAALRSQRLIYVDCGTRDEYGLHWGARALVSEMKKHGIAVTHEEFDDGHMNIPFRFERSIPLLAQALEGAGG
jgi:enterochelin esterase family protein